MMPNTSNSVSLLTPAEMSQLDSWSFIKSYKKDHENLLYLAKGVYRILLNLLNDQPPTQDEFCYFYGEVLKLTNLYVKQIAGKKLYLPKSLYDYFAVLLAKYVVEQNWVNISTVSSSTELKAGSISSTIPPISEEMISEEIGINIKKALGTTSTQEAEQGISEAGRIELEERYLTRKKFTVKDFAISIFTAALRMIALLFADFLFIIISYFIFLLISHLNSTFSFLPFFALFIAGFSFIITGVFTLFQDARDFIKKLVDENILIHPFIIVLRITSIFIIYFLLILLILYIINFLFVSNNQQPTFTINVFNALKLISLIGIAVGYVSEIGYSLYQQRIQEKRYSVRIIQKALKD